jgi:hypothetical protein
VALARWQRQGGVGSEGKVLFTSPTKDKRPLLIKLCVRGPVLACRCLQDTTLAAGAMRFVASVVRREAKDREVALERASRNQAFAAAMNAAERALLAAIRSDKVPYEGGARVGPLESPGGELKDLVVMLA